jgi:hypothetical protein
MKLLNLITACVAAAALAGCASNTNQLPPPDAAPDSAVKQQVDSQAEVSQGDANQPEANQPDADQGSD